MEDVVAAFVVFFGLGFVLVLFASWFSRRLDSERRAAWERQELVERIRARGRLIPVEVEIGGRKLNALVREGDLEEETRP